MTTTERDQETTPVVRNAAATRFIGQRLVRREDARLVTGRGRYVDDVVVPGVLHVAFTRSDIARGTITSIDIAAALELEGVVAVFTGSDLNSDIREAWVDFEGPEGGTPMYRVLAEGDVRFVGEPIALIVATSRYIAEDAADLVEVDIDPQPAVIGAVSALADGAPVVHPELGTNIAGAIPHTDDPEIDDMFVEAAHVITETFSQHRYMCVPMETRGIVSQWDPSTQQLVVHISTQGPHGVRGFLARALGIAENTIRVIMGDVGGGFGQKMFMLPDELGVVLAGRRLGRPLKWIEDRRENLLAGQHAREDSMTVSFAVDDDGKIRGVRADLTEDVGSFAAAGSSAIGFVGPVFPGPYSIPKVQFAARAVHTNTCGRSSYRGPWMMETLVREQMMDVVARELGIDPLELRRRNVVQQDQLPYTTATGLLYDSISPAETLEQAASMIDYDAWRAAQEAARQEGRLLGLGLGLYVEPSGLAMGSLSSEAATVNIGVNGQVQAIMSSASHGQSVETTVAQVVADELGVDYDDVTVVQGDTSASPFGPGTGGSRSAVLASGAAREATARVKAKIMEIAAHTLEAAPEDLELSAGSLSVVGTPSRSISLREIAQTAYIGPDALPSGMEMGLEGFARYTPSAPFTWSNSCHVCTCEIDELTGAVVLTRYVVSEDCGVMINPMVVEGQIAGGVVQGIGGVLYEHMPYDEDGTPLASTLMDYLLPTAAEVPELEYGHVETPATTNPGGHKGMGEGGAIGSPPAVVNAVADALASRGVRVTAQPLGPANIVALLGADR